jgi:hypothetical protein
MVLRVVMGRLPRLAVAVGAPVRPPTEIGERAGPIPFELRVVVERRAARDRFRPARVASPCPTACHLTLVQVTCMACG